MTSKRLLDTMLGYYGNLLTNDLIQFVDKLPQDSLILDFGGGSGKFSVQVAQKRRDVLSCCVDIHLPSLRKAKRNISENIKRRLDLILCDVRYLPFRSGMFEAGLVINVLHHLSSPTIFFSLQELRRVLRKGGVIFVEEGVADNPLVPLLYKRIWRFVPTSLKKRVGMSELSLCEMRTSFFKTNTLESYLKYLDFEIFKKEREEIFVYFLYYLVKIVTWPHYFIPVSVVTSLYKIERSLLRYTPFSLSVRLWARKRKDSAIKADVLTKQCLAK